MPLIARRTLLASLTSPIVWRVPGHAARKLLQFSAAERASELDLRAAARLTTSDARRALYLKHAIDEARHAVAFATRANDLRAIDERGPLPLPEADTEQLFATLGEVRFLAFVHRGEARGRAQFVAYRDHFGRDGDDKSRAMFDVILKDEERHESYTRALLVEVCGSEALAREELTRAALWEAWRTWRRAGRFVATLLYRALMTVLYVAMAPLAVWVRLVRREKRGFVRPLASTVLASTSLVDADVHAGSRAGGQPPHHGGGSALATAVPNGKPAPRSDSGTE